MRDGIAAGDLVMPENTTPDQLVFGLWSVTYGGYSIMQGERTLEQMGIADGFRMVRNINNRLLDGFNWKPLSSRFDFDAVYDRVRREIFSGLV